MLRPLFAGRPWRSSRGVVALVIVLAALLAPWIAPTNPYDPSSLNLMDGFTPPM